MGTKDKASNQAQHLKGTVKEAAGKVTGDNKLRQRQDRPKRRLRSRGLAKVSRTPLPTSKTPSRASRRCVWTGIRPTKRLRPTASCVVPLSIPSTLKPGGVPDCSIWL